LQCHVISCQWPVSKDANPISAPVMTVDRDVAATCIVAWISPIEFRHSTDIAAEPQRLSVSVGFPL